jgi:hypothetical protein
VLSEQGLEACGKLETRCEVMLGIVDDAARIIMGNTTETRQLENYIRDRKQNMRETIAKLNVSPVGRKLE